MSTHSSVLWGIDEENFKRDKLSSTTIYSIACLGCNSKYVGELLVARACTVLYGHRPRNR